MINALKKKITALTSLNSDFQKKQNQRFFLFLLFLFGLILFIGWGSSQKKEVSSEKSVPSQKPFQSALEHIDAPTAFFEQTKHLLESQNKKMADLNEHLKQMQDHIKSLQKEFQEKNRAFDEQLALLEPSRSSHATSLETLEMPALPMPRHLAEKKPLEATRTQIKSVSLKLQNLKKSTHLEKTPDNFVPAGTHVHAILISAADAPAGITSQADPLPVLFRIRGDGILPNGHHSHLKGCFAIGAIKGDVSSERGVIRLERLSCVHPDQHITEQEINGTIAGMDAKNGLRGTPVWRETPLIGRAFAAGALSGIATGLASSYQQNSVSALGSVNTLDPKNLAQYGAAQGTANAMEKLADYHIKRAEQYHPVIQISAGQRVDLIFTKGFYLRGQTP